MGARGVRLAPLPNLDALVGAMVALVVLSIVESYAKWLAHSTIPKLFVDAEPAGFLIGAQREFCRAWPNQQTVLVKGSHFLQEEAPHEVGAAIAGFVSRVLAGQIR
jgi:haloalkane dehalogenase